MSRHFSEYELADYLDDVLPIEQMTAVDRIAPHLQQLLPNSPATPCTA